MGLLEDLQRQVLIGDGAMGTLLYSYGIDRCFEELNISKPEEIQRIHKAYVEAGANIIQTNTYGANYIKLSRHGLEDDIKKMNQEAVKIARASAGDAYVLGTMGGIRTFNKNAYSLDDIKRSFREQLYLLLHEEPDGLLLETYYDLEEAREVLKIARKETDLPIMLNVSMHEQGVLQDGTPLSDALRSIADLGADIVGINCRLGPYHMIEALSEVPIFDDVFLSVYPNSSLPSLEEDGSSMKQMTRIFKTARQNSVSKVRGLLAAAVAPRQIISGRWQKRLAGWLRLRKKKSKPERKNSFLFITSEPSPA